MISKEFEATLGEALREARERRHEYLCAEHVLFAILHDARGADILRACGGNLAHLEQQLEDFFKEEMEPAPEGVQPTIQQTTGFDRLMQRAFLHVQYSGREAVDAGDILVAMLEEDDSHATWILQEDGIARLDILNYISHGITVDGADIFGDEVEDDGDEEDRPGRRSARESFTVNLNQLAAEGAIDPLIGRDEELKRTVRILSRRKKNNPIFVGEPGVGKTALAEGLALAIHEGRVPKQIADLEIISVDLAGMLAGTKFRGDFEERLKNVLKELQGHPQYVLYIDEIHTLVGAGATTESSMDASTILKPALASGELRCIGSTTYEEYKNHFEKDRGLSRRFQKIDINEPSVPETVQILKGLKSRYEEHHDIQFTNGALYAAADLSSKHINDRFLPDKAIDVIDEAAAAVRLESGGTRKTIRTHDIERIVAEIARIPERSVSSSDKEQLASLEQNLLHSVYGQDDAITQITRAIKRSRAGLGRQDKPIGCFLFTGPTGVGKTEVARQLARQLGNHFARYDMSEYMEKHAVSRLIGAPPGYVGFDQGGLLVDEIRRNPYTVLLLDELEKAHADIFNVLLQVMDNASLTDNMGKKADFRNVILIMTSNAGARELASGTIGFQAGENDSRHKSIKAVEKAFSPEFRNRLDAVVAFNPLPMTVIEQVAEKFIIQLQHQLAEKKVDLSLSPDARRWLADKGYDEKFGARPMARLIAQEVETPLADELLFGRLEKGGKVTVDVENDAIVLRFDET